MRVLSAAWALPFGWHLARAEDLMGPLTLLVAGPDGQQTSRWGSACALALAAAWPGTPEILTEPVGGLDGVTGGNRLDALVVPDGMTAAILPGASLMAWLTGDSRVHFDPTRWVPLMAAGGSGVLVVRLPAGAVPSLGALRAMAPVRLAVDQPQSNDLVSLLALTRLQVRTAPVFGLREVDARMRAFVAGEVDAVFVSGENVLADIAPLSAAGGVPVFSLGCALADGTLVADPEFPAVPDVISFGGDTPPFLDTVFRAAVAVARLDFLMVLPRLTDPGAVAQWQQAALGAIAMPALSAAASASSIVLEPAPVLGVALDALNRVAAEQTDLQAYLAKSFGWQPG
jgi:hypothetical protein